MPNGALKCKEGMDKIEAEMRPDFRRKVCMIWSTYHMFSCMVTAFLCPTEPAVLGYVVGYKVNQQLLFSCCFCRKV